MYCHNKKIQLWLFFLGWVSNFFNDPHMYISMFKKYSDWSCIYQDRMNNECNIDFLPNGSLWIQHPWLRRVFLKHFFYIAVMSSRLRIYWLYSLQGRTPPPLSRKRVVQCKTLTCMALKLEFWTSGECENPFIVITPKSTLTLSGSICKDPIDGSNRYVW